MSLSPTSSSCFPLRTLLGRSHTSFRKHTALHGKAELLILDVNGSSKARKFDVFIGHPYEAYAIIDPDAGLAMKPAIAKQTGMLFKDATPYPRTVIEDDLPRQDATNASPATLWFWGAIHAVISLDGTPDREYCWA
ncbi:hypothetical protein CH63R_05637 [Colletotrichum higginsianum IMI 349063]|uniref:Uncharacterized protein n=1 Tax=Colletotrichum higginsianum (strain IMI 349063) TaxID=759273 RepID=A0A1B7YD32_COLHI|nr:hypothetical protein CH63R_05637 [Colletotrichum higginsianum IMI 349063]OBR09945.1 hypothetical protein CH63R_05637 [Colletotrichum higginsianum IMI 349063]